MTRTAPAGRTLRFITVLSARLTCPKPNARPIRHSPLCRIGTAKFFTLLLLLYRTLANVGGFKVVPNTIGVVNMIETSSLETTEQDVDSLLDDYSKLTQVTLEDIIDFHVKFERIHPFGDGNGRVGRIIMFKECLKNNIMPFIILDQDKPYYIRGLKEYNRDKKYLIDTILHSEDIYENSCEQLLDFDIKED